MSESQTFIEACLAGNAGPGDVDDWIDRWHGGEGPELSLEDYLGFTDREEEEWIRHPDRLTEIVARHRNLHLIYTDHGPKFGWSIESPQVPELIGGRSKLNDLIRDTNLILEFADAPIKDADAAGVWRHEQIATKDPSGFEYLIRWLVNEEVDGDDPMSRLSTAGRLLSSAREGYPSYLRARQPELVTGERLLIAVMGTDKIGFCLDQLKEGQGAIIAQHRGEDAVYSVPIGISSSLDGWTWELEDLGLTRDDDVEKVIDRVLDWEASKLGSRPEALKNYALNLPPSRIPQGDMVRLHSAGSVKLH